MSAPYLIVLNKVRPIHSHVMEGGGGGVQISPRDRVMGLGFDVLVASRVLTLPCCQIALVVSQNLYGGRHISFILFQY